MTSFPPISIEMVEAMRTEATCHLWLGRVCVWPDYAGDSRF